ncbi:helix-turn-helix domain-containing protein [Bremerella alba]|nr:helix-turn-helix domain-containing protein [Bremerella alba]
MSNLYNAKEAAQLLGIRTSTLYEWLSKSDAGEFEVRGIPFVVNYLQGGKRGQGRIKIEPSEVERLKEAMRVRPNVRYQRIPSNRTSFPGITVPLGRPDNPVR